MMDFMKGFLVALLVVAYFVLPDLFPGPIDDLLVAVLAIMGTVGKNRGTEFLDE